MIVQGGGGKEKKEKRVFHEIHIKTRTSAARPERDRLCDRGEEAAAAAAAPTTGGGCCCCSAHSSSVRKVDMRTGLEAGPTDAGPDRTMDHSTLLKRDVLAPSPKSNSSSL